MTRASRQLGFTDVVKCLIRPSLLAVLLFSASAQASSGSLSLLQSWKNLGNAPIAVSPDGSLVATTRSPARKPTYAPYSTRIDVRDTRSMKRLYQAQPANGDGKTLLFSPDSRTLWSAHTGTIHYDARSGKPLENREGSDGPGVSALAFATDGKQYVLAGVNVIGDSSVGLVDTMTGKWLWSGTPYPPTKAEGARANWVHSLAFSPDGLLVASGSGGGGVIVRNAKTGKRLRHLIDTAEAATQAMQKGWTAHADTVTEVHFLSPMRLLSASRDGTLKLWNAETGELIARMRLAGGLLAADATADGRILAATGRGLVLLATKQDELRMLETLWSTPHNPFTDVSVSQSDGKNIHVWLIARKGTLSHWLLH